MKKLLCAVIALTSVSAFAQKSMVTLSGYETGDRQDRSLDFTNVTGGSGHDNTSNLAINYAYAVTDALQVGVLYKKFKATSGDDLQLSDDGRGGDQTTMGVQVIWNFANKLTDTSYVAVHYDMLNSKETDLDSDGNDIADNDFKTNTLGLEYGHRFSLGTLGGMNFNYSPSATLAFAKTNGGDTDVIDDQSTTSVTLNFVKFDVLF
jgi:hypothetical protein